MKNGYYILMKNLRKIIIIFLLLCFYCYFINIVNFPSTIITYSEDLENYRLCPFLKLEGEVETTSSELQSEYDLELSLGNITLKEVSLNIVEKTYVVPIGEIVGIKLYIDGVMIVGFSQIENINGELESIENTSNLEEGDRIIKVNDRDINSIEDLREEINSSYGEDLNIVIENIDGETKNEIISPIQTGENEYKIGLWVKDGATGVGTISFYNPETNEFVALGHGITDSDTGELISIETGEITGSDMISLTKGISGSPGEVNGTINTDEIIGTIEENTQFGLYGTIENTNLLNIDEDDLVEVALRDEITEGAATVLCSIDGETTKEYEIEIEKIFYENSSDNKSFVIRVTDEELIEATGGIIRGLSRKPNFTKWQINRSCNQCTCI